MEKYITSYAPPRYRLGAVEMFPELSSIIATRIVEAQERVRKSKKRLQK